MKSLLSIPKGFLVCWQSITSITMENIVFYLNTLSFSKQVPNIFHIFLQIVYFILPSFKLFLWVMDRVSLTILSFFCLKPFRIFPLHLAQKPNFLLFVIASGTTLPLLTLSQHTHGLVVHRKFTDMAASGPLYMLFFCLEYCSPHFFVWPATSHLLRHNLHVISFKKPSL